MKCYGKKKRTTKGTLRRSKKHVANGFAKANKHVEKAFGFVNKGKAKTGSATSAITKSFKGIA